MGTPEMDELRRSYVRMCHERGVEPQEGVLGHLQGAKETAGRGKLDLSSQSVSTESCKVLGVLLQNDVTFTDVILSDCMLSEDGVKALLQGLRTNSLIKHLDLKGNNLRAQGAEALGKLLTANTSLTSLTLQWNNLGMLEDAFSLFCDGLAVNQTLQKLDLRNNQISPKGAEELSMALKRNHTLQELDLRWNNIGLLGGRAILSCLSTNRSLLKMDLSGNNIPSDILKPIEQTVGHNQERLVVKKDNLTQRQILTKEVQSLKQEKNKQILNLMETIEQQREEMTRSSRTTNLQMGKLHEALEDRKSVVNSLTAKLQLAESNLALSQQKVQDLGELLSQAKRASASLREQQAKELRKEKEESVAREAKLRQELTSAAEKNLYYRSKVDELERRCKAQQEHVLELKQELTDTSAELKLRAMQAEERLEAEKKRSRQLRDDAAVLHQKEVDQMKQYVDDVETAAQERMQRLEATKLGLEEELNKAKMTLANERIHAEEEIQKARSSVQLEEQQNSAVLQDKLRTLTLSRDQAHNQVLQEKQLAGELRAQNNQLSLEIEGLKRRIGGFIEELAKKDQEKMAEVTMVRIELQQQVGHLQAELAAQDGLKEKICALERQQKAQSVSHREMMLDKEAEMSSLMEKLRLKDAEILRMREEETQRATLLQNAILSYIHSSPLSTTAAKK
ncbi:leucine-rich repeat-containing protein 45 [Spea bombifrons]|uniref:leucine-rich repeat-containing protein 45 n=1 Tax=Spea bombifrons TaxID=233779 RepID=UPI00234B19C0|nr:leucine-rich repeat-containing protein 45 [Spea bombifrons]